MGMQTAQAAQPISQQQPSQGKGTGSVAPESDATVLRMPMPDQAASQPTGKGGTSGVNQNPAQHRLNQQFQGKGSTTNAATSGQPQMGQPNSYPNTIQPWDNANIQPKQSSTDGGKGKGY